jgi:hypothetical protein
VLIENLIPRQAPPAAIAFSLTKNGDKVTLVAHKVAIAGLGD